MRNLHDMSNILLTPVIAMTVMLFHRRRPRGRSIAIAYAVLGSRVRCNTSRTTGGCHGTGQRCALLSAWVPRLRDSPETYIRRTGHLHLHRSYGSLRIGRVDRQANSKKSTRKPNISRKRPEKLTSRVGANPHIRWLRALSKMHTLAAVARLRLSACP